MAADALPSGGCYSLQMICALPGHEDDLWEWRSDEFTGRNSRECYRNARRTGWRRLSGNFWACPRHHKGEPMTPHPDGRNYILQPPTGAEGGADG